MRASRRTSGAADAGATGLGPLVRHKWALPALAALRKTGGGAKFVTLWRRLGASRAPLRQALDNLVEAGLVERNPGYGHPMRPEYVLTRAGANVAPAAERVVEALRRLDAEDVGLRKWSLPVLAALLQHGGADRFGGLQAALPTVTPRALTLALKELQAVGLVDRQVLEAYPPRTRYRLTRAAQPLRAPLRVLSQAA